MYIHEINVKNIEIFTQFPCEVQTIGRDWKTHTVKNDERKFKNTSEPIDWFLITLVRANARANSTQKQFELSIN